TSCKSGSTGPLPYWNQDFELVSQLPITVYNTKHMFGKYILWERMGNNSGIFLLSGKKKRTNFPKDDIITT
ncbi:hypothetical protein D7V83_00005, partial [bacterium 0.1xD8-71]